ncbi:MAG: flavodoxin family protein, partial [Pseudomonadota bacterium]
LIPLNRPLKLVVAYTSGAGHTAKLAEAITSGATQNGMQASALDVKTLPEDTQDKAWTILHEAHCIVLGSPTYMGGVSAPFKAFMDASSDFWMDQRWANKIAGGFTIGSRRSGDKLTTLQHLAIFGAQQGMVWVGQGIVGGRGAGQNESLNPDGSWLGLMATSSADKSEMIDAATRQTAQEYGKRLAQATLRWNAISNV